MTRMTYIIYQCVRCNWRCAHNSPLMDGALGVVYVCPTCRGFICDCVCVPTRGGGIWGGVRVPPLGDGACGEGTNGTNLNWNARAMRRTSCAAGQLIKEPSSTSTLVHLITSIVVHLNLHNHGAPHHIHSVAPKPS